jgi:hypothetical protein
VRRVGLATAEPCGRRGAARDLASDLALDLDFGPSLLHVRSDVPVRAGSCRHYPVRYPASQGHIFAGMGAKAQVVAGILEHSSGLLIRRRIGRVAWVPVGNPFRPSGSDGHSADVPIAASLGDGAGRSGSRPAAGKQPSAAGRRRTEPADRYVRNISQTSSPSVRITGHNGRGSAKGAVIRTASFARTLSAICP